MTYMAALLVIATSLACKTSSSKDSEAKVGYGEGWFGYKNVIFSQSHKNAPSLRCFFAGDISFGQTLKGIKKSKSLCSKPYPDVFVSEYTREEAEEIGLQAKGDAYNRWAMLRDLSVNTHGFDLNSGSYKGHYDEKDIERISAFYAELCGSLPEAEFSCPETFNGKKYLDNDAEQWDINDPSLQLQ